MAIVEAVNSSSGIDCMLPWGIVELNLFPARSQ